MSQLIIAPPIGETPIIAITEAGEKIKKELVLQSSIIQRVESDAMRDAAIDIAGQIKAHIDQVEKTRKEIKEPFFRTGQDIDAAAKKHVDELKSECARLNEMSGGYESNRRRAAEQAERQRQQEEKRLLDEAAAKQRESERLAEESRKAAEAKAAAGKEPTAEERVKALKDQLRLEEEQEANAAEFRRLEQARVDARAKQLEAAPTGGSLREELDIEVTDIHALYKAQPMAVKLTIDLAFVKGMIKRGVEYPGIIVTRRQVFATKAQR